MVLIKNVHKKGKMQEHSTMDDHLFIDLMHRCEAVNHLSPSEKKELQKYKFEVVKPRYKVKSVGLRGLGKIPKNLKKFDPEAKFYKSIQTHSNRRTRMRKKRMLEKKAKREKKF